MIYDANIATDSAEIKGYGLQLKKFEKVIYQKTKQEIIDLADVILITFGKPSLLVQLNEMQAEASVCDNKGFENKYEIRPYFINLILDKYNMKVVGW